MKKWLLLLPSIFLGSFLLTLLVFFDKTDQISNKYISKISPENEIVVRVGNESIYRKDLDFELLYLSYGDKTKRSAIAMEKLIKDSVILQAASEQNLISLDKTVFNSSDKNYFKRLDLVRVSEREVELNSDIVEGILVTVKFGEDSEESDIPYTDRKKVAYDNIKQSRNFYLQENPSIKQIENWFGNNPSTITYKISAISLKKDETIGLNHRLEDNIWETTTGGVTDIYVGVEKYDKNSLPVDSYYSYVIVTKRVKDGQDFEFNRWYESKVGNYDIHYL